MPLNVNNKDFSCRTCKHGQNLAENGNYSQCRALPPVSCCDGEAGEPRFPMSGGDFLTWCSAWMQVRDARRPRILYSPELIVDGNMEIANAGKWRDEDNATLSKAAFPHGGSLSLQVLATAGGAAVAGQAAPRPLYFPRNGSYLNVSGWAYGDGTNKPSVVIDSALIWTGVKTAAWQNFNFNCVPATPWTPTIDRYFDLLLICGDAGTLMGGLSLFDDVTVKQITRIDPEISCWTCKHFQRLGVTRAGECRSALGPAPQCAEQVPGWEPCFPRMFDASAEWCSAWMQGRGLTADLPPLENWNPELPPALYPTGGN